MLFSLPTTAALLSALLMAEAPAADTSPVEAPAADTSFVEAPAAEVAPVPPLPPAVPPPPVVPAPPPPAPGGLRIGGELKALWNGFDDFGPAQAFPGVVLVQFAAARLVAEGAVAPWAQVEAHLAVESATWNMSLPFFEALGADAIIVTAPQALPLQTDLTRLLESAERFQVRLRTDRLNVKLGDDRASITLGRQPLAQGYVSLFPVLGHLTPVPVTALEREYVPGMDAVTVAYAPLRDVRLKLIYALGGDWERDRRGAFAVDKARAALTAEARVGETELLLVSSVLRGMPLVGAGARRQLGPWHLAGEVAYAHEQTPLRSVRGFGMATLSVGHRFASGLSVTAETAYYGFGAGRTDGYPAIIQWTRVQQGDLPFYFGRFHAGVTAQQPLGERFLLGVTTLGSLQDGSGIVMSSLAMRAGERVVAMLSGWLPFGPRPVEPLLVNAEYALANYMLGMEVRHYF